MRIAIRVDSSISMGLGHFMRCLALAQAWQEKGEKAKFILADKAPAIEERLNADGMETAIIAARPGSLEDAKKTVAVAKENSAEWIILDGYHFGADYQKAIKDAGYRMLCIDDYGHATHYYADLVLNQNISADASLYMNREPYTHLLLGTRYALLRKEFWPWRGLKRDIPDVARKLLVTLGGGDPDNVTLKVIQALEIMDVEGLEGIIVIGGTNPSLEIVRDTARHSRHNLRIENNVKNMPELMAWADVAVTAGGSTCWELAFMGLPSVVLVLAENQRAVAEKLAATGLAVNLGWHEHVSLTDIKKAINQLLLSPEVRAEMVRKGQVGNDGLGTNRVVEEIIAQSLTVRKVRKSDCELLWEWVNDSDVRKSAFCSEHIPIEEHKRWFSEIIMDCKCVQLIGLNGGDMPVGQVRFDIYEDEAEIDVSVAREHRGKGYGHELIKKGVQSLLKETKVRIVHAFVKPENKASLQAFLKAGFVRRGMKTVRGQNAKHLIWKRKE